MLWDMAENDQLDAFNHAMNVCTNSGSLAKKIIFPQSADRLTGLERKIILEMVRKAGEAFRTGSSGGRLRKHRGVAPPYLTFFCR
jgi:hypothetical protein